MNETTGASGGNEPADELGDTLFSIGSLVMPFVRMYLGPSAAIIERGEREPLAAERRLMLFAVHKLVIEAGTLPAPGTAYEPHEAAFNVDDKGQAAALDLRYLLAAARALSAWASAEPAAPPDPAPTAADSATVLKTTQPSTYAPMSARSLRMNARAASYGAESPAMSHAASANLATASRSGGCGCRGGAASYGSAKPNVRTTSKRRRTAPGCTDPKPRCDCAGSCGGRGCGCSGKDSCIDCIPRGSPAADGCAPSCACGTCKPPEPEKCTPWTPSCETRNRLRACLKDVLCDLLKCVEHYLCPDRSAHLEKNWALKRQAEFYLCLREILCKLLRCVREAICPAPVAPALPCPPPMDCLPCSYAVEDPR